MKMVRSSDFLQMYSEAFYDEILSGVTNLFFLTCGYYNICYSFLPQYPSLSKEINY